MRTKVLFGSQARAPRSTGRISRVISRSRGGNLQNLVQAEDLRSSEMWLLASKIENLEPLGPLKRANLAGPSGKAIFRLFQITRLRSGSWPGLPNMRCCGEAIGMCVS